MIRQLVHLADGYHVAYFHNPQPGLAFRASADYADFRDAGDRITLAGLGLFSIDKACHRAARQFQALLARKRDEDYALLMLDRCAVERMVAQEVMRAGLVPDGCWPRSTGAYAARMEQEDAAARRWADQIRAGIDKLDELMIDPDLEEDDHSGDPADMGEPDDWRPEGFVLPKPVYGDDQTVGPINEQAAHRAWHKHLMEG